MNKFEINKFSVLCQEKCFKLEKISKKLITNVKLSTYLSIVYLNRPFFRVTNTCVCIYIAGNNLVMYYFHGHIYMFIYIACNNLVMFYFDGHICQCIYIACNNFVMYYFHNLFNLVKYFKYIIDVFSIKCKTCTDLHFVYFQIWIVVRTIIFLVTWLYFFIVAY